MQNRPYEESPCDLVRLKRHGWPRRKPMGLPSLLAEVSGGGFAGSPDVPANVTAAIVCPQYAGMHRVECETSGLGPWPSRKRFTSTGGCPQWGYVETLPGHRRWRGLRPVSYTH